MENLLSEASSSPRLRQTLRPGLLASKIIGLPHYCILQNASFLVPNFFFLWDIGKYHSGFYTVLD